MKKGISLIVLVITIIVIIILAGAVILSISQNNPISSASEATFKESIKAYESELGLYIAKQYTNANPVGSYDIKTANYSKTTTPVISEVIKSMKTEDIEKFEIKEGKLVYIGSNTNEEKWVVEIGIGIGIPEKLGEGTRDKSQATYNKPYVPSGFKYLEGTVNTGENKGYVIQDKNNGNEFVWIPVYGEILTEYNDGKTSSKDPLPDNMTSEEDVIKYGGFYIGRYEAGNQDGKAVSKKEVSVWNEIEYANSESDGAYDLAKEMYTTDEVKSGLMTKEMWDATCKWLEISGAKTNSEIYTDSTGWGNYTDYNYSVTDDKQVPSAGNLTTTGFSENWKANNIYDLAGNVWEWTNEKITTNSVYRGGDCNNSGSSEPVSGSDYDPVSSSDSSIGFRHSLYIK